MDLTKGNISSKLIRFAIPIILLQFLNCAYSIVDNVIVARMVGEQALSVVSTVSNTLMVGYCLMQGLSNAAMILTGNLFGSKCYQELRKLVSGALLLILMISVGVCCVYLFGSDGIFAILKVPEEIPEDCHSIMWIYAVSLIPTYLCSYESSVLNGLGNSKAPMFISIGCQVVTYSHHLSPGD